MYFKVVEEQPIRQNQEIVSLIEMENYLNQSKLIEKSRCLKIDDKLTKNFFEKIIAQKEQEKITKIQ